MLSVFKWRRFALDSLAWVIVIPFAALLRFDLNSSAVSWMHVGRVMLLAVVLQILLGTLLGSYLGNYSWGSLEGVGLVMLTVALDAGILWVWTLGWSHYAQVPRTLLPIAAPMAMVVMAGFRYGWRLLLQARPASSSDQSVPVLLYGAGFIGDVMTRWLSTESRPAMIPVGLLDDDPSKRRLKLHGVPVLGTLQDLPRIVEKTGAKVLLVTFSDPSPEKLNEVQTLASKHGMRVQVTPTSHEILKKGVPSTTLRNLDIQDLLGRDQVDTDVSAIAGYLTGKRVLVTGAGGSIGHQLCVEIHKYGPAELMLLDRDETGIQQTAISLKGNGLLNTDDVILADIRDAQALTAIFAERRPEVVFHAAALKHLPMLEQYPEEAWKTNVMGTVNVLHAAFACGTDVLINISTDKAANPTSVLGLSKRMAEVLTARMNRDNENIRYLSVRFGNVLGSRGSMLPTFRTLIEEGKPLTVTHPDITRYFMTIPEACQLVLQAGAIGRSGEVLVLDMGEPVRIMDIAQKMIDMSGKDISIQITGLRKGEKLHEDLHSSFEKQKALFHPKVFHTEVRCFREEEPREIWEALVVASPEERPEMSACLEGALPRVG